MTTNEIAKRDGGAVAQIDPIAADRLVDKFWRAIVRDGHTETLPALPTAPERALMQARNLALASMIRPISYAATSRDRANKAIQRMFRSYPQLRNADAVQMTVAYLEDLMSLPPFAIEQAVEDIKTGKVPGLDPDWPPSSARVYQTANPIAETVRMKCLKMDAVLRIDRVSKAPPTELERQRVGEMMKGLGARLKNDLQSERTELEERVLARGLEDDQRKMRQWYEDNGIEPAYSMPGRLMSPSLYVQLRGDPAKAPKRAGAKR